MSVLAVDPGLNHPAVAYLLDGKIAAAHRVRISTAYKDLPILDRCDAVGEDVVEALLELVGLHGGTPHVLVVEWPQWYPRGKSKGSRRTSWSGSSCAIDPNDLAALCGIAGSVLGRLRERGHEPQVRSPKPHEVWGNLPKAERGDPWASPRARRLASRITPAERAGIQNKHDALDAAGLALWGAGRWAPRSNYPGAV